MNQRFSRLAAAAFAAFAQERGMTNPANSPNSPNSPYMQARERVFIIMNAMSADQRVALIQEIIRKYQDDINDRTGGRPGGSQRNG